MLLRHPILLRTLLIVFTILGSWIGMQWVHEAGHVLGALCTGGSIQSIQLPPLNFSQTHIHPNPHPLIASWAGAVFGVIMPLLIWLTAWMASCSWAYLCRFFAGFCLIANGCYLGVGVFFKAGDCHDLLRHGSEPWQLIGFGIISVPMGLAMWHGLGSSFNLGPNREPIHPEHVAVLILGTMTAWTAEWILLFAH